jgi:hypothetical protein
VLAMLRRTPGSSPVQNPPESLEGTLVYPNGTRQRVTGDLDFGFVNPHSGVSGPRRFCLYTFTHTDTDKKVGVVPVFRSDLENVEAAVTERLETRTGAKVEALS